MSKVSCDSFVRLIPHFEELASRETKDAVSYQDWCDHLQSCKPCSDETLYHRVAAWHVNAAAYPCIHMAYRANQMCALHEERSECPDLVIGYDEVFDEYSIIKDGVSIAISYCPWCGSALPASQRDRWFSELEAQLGGNPVASPERVPELYRTRAWRT